MTFKNIYISAEKKIIKFNMRVSAIQWSKLFSVVLSTHKYMYTSSTTFTLGPLGMHYQFSHFNNWG